MKRLSAPALLALLAACTSGPAGGNAATVALPEPTGDIAIDAAALLAAAENAPSDRARAPLVERLDAMNVRLAADANVQAGADDPLAQWRSRMAPADAAPWRGRALGPAYRRARVEPGESLVIEQIFLAGQRAEIAAHASTGGSAVALKVNNPRAEAVCARELAPRASCNWLPVFTERFAIALENRGTEPASVYLVFR